MRPRATKVLELGVFLGASLRMWRDWYQQAMVHGADHFKGQQGNGKSFKNADKFLNEVTAGQHSRIVLHRLDQSSRWTWKVSQTSRSRGPSILLWMMRPIVCWRHSKHWEHYSVLLSRGSFFVIEDINSSLCHDYDVEPDGSNSTLRMIQMALAGHGWKSKYMSPQEMEFLNNTVDIDSTRIYGSEKAQTCVIRRHAIAMTKMDSKIKPGRVVVINYASFDELNQSRQQQHISWVRRWGEEALSDATSGVTSFDVVSFGPDSLDDEFYKQNKLLLSQKRGGGYWLWKPYILKAMLEATNAEFVIYCDCGSIILKPLAAVLKALHLSGAKILAFDTSSNGWIEHQWTKGQVLRAMNATDPAISATGQIAGGVSIWHRSSESIRIVDEWLKFMQNPAFL